MGKAAFEDSTGFRYHVDARVHASMCKELIKMLDGVTILVPAIESAQPGCKSGIVELCSLNKSVEKGYLLVRHCVESSKLYAVITCKATIARCERMQATIIRSLSIIASLVREPLSSQVTKLLHTTRNIRFSIDPYEEEAGEVLLSLLCQADIDEDTEIRSFQIVASRLNLRSSKALLIETRCIKKLMEYFCGLDSKKEKILNYFFYLLKKYGTGLCKTSNCDQIFVKRNSLKAGENAGVRKEGSSFRESKRDYSFVKGHQTDVDDTPEEFICPISRRLMYDPVNIASGQTYERMWIEKWFALGHDTCPKTEQRLMNFKIIANSSIKSLISQWCQNHGVAVQNPCSQPIPSIFHTWDMLRSPSVSSLDNLSACLLDNAKMHCKCDTSNDTNVSVVSSSAATCSDLSHIQAFENSTDSCSPMFSWSDDFQKCRSFAEFSYDSYLKFLTDLSKLPLNMHKTSLEDVKLLFSSDYHTLLLMHSNGFDEALVSFLKDAYESSNVSAQRTGLQILEAFLDNSRFDSLNEIASFLLARVLDSELSSEALSLILRLCQFSDCISTVVKSGVCSSLIEALKHGETKYSGLALEILSQLSSHVQIQSLILSSNFLSILVCLLRENRLTGSCLRILLDLCSNGAAAAVVKTGGCLDSMLELLDLGGPDEQADVVAILYALCSTCPEYCVLILQANVIQSLVDISVNGTPSGMTCSKKLIHLLEDVKEHDYLDESLCVSQSPPLQLPPKCLKKGIGTETKPSSKSDVLPGTKSFFTKCKAVFHK